MQDQDERILSAQVVLKPKDGRGLSPAENVTSENVERVLPAAEDFEKAQSFFADAGFEAAGGFANSFSITGKHKLFEQTFGAKIFTNEKRAVKVRAAKDAESSKLPLEKLPAEIKKIVETVTFTEPPDFGPGNF